MLSLDGIIKFGRIGAQSGACIAIKISLNMDVNGLPQVIISMEKIITPATNAQSITAMTAVTKTGSRILSPVFNAKGTIARSARNLVDARIVIRIFAKIASLNAMSMNVMTNFALNVSRRAIAMSAINFTARSVDLTFVKKAATSVVIAFSH